MVNLKIEHLLGELNKDNIEEIKPVLSKYVKLVLMGLGESEEQLSCEQVDEIHKLMTMRYEFREEAKLAEDLKLVAKVKKAYDELLHHITREGYIYDAIKLTSDALKGIGGHARLAKLRILNKKNTKYFQSEKYLEDLKKELYIALEKKSAEGIMAELYLVTGIINSVAYSLMEESQEHGRSVIQLLTDYKSGKTKSIDEFKEDGHIEELKVKLDSKYGKELQRRIYLWDKLTLGLKSPYFLEELYKEL